MKNEFGTYQEFIDQQLPPAARAYIPQALRTAYGLVDKLADENQLFATPCGIYAKGHLIPVAVEFMLHKLLVGGQWDVDMEWAWHAKPTGKHLAIYLPRAVLTVSQLQHPSAFPRRAEFRENQRLNNNPGQLTFLQEWDDEVREKSTRPHLVLAHGYRQLSYAHIGIPHSERATWVYKSPNILKELHTAESNLPATETAAVDPLLSLKEEFVEELARNERENRRS